jgi:spore germination protein
VRVLRGLGAPLVACLAAASVLAVVVPGQAGAQNPPPPRKFVTGWLPYWNTAEATKSVVDNANLFQDASPFVFDANSRTDISLTADTDEWRQMRRSLRSAGVANIPTVATDLSADEFARIVKNPDRRADHARALAQVVGRYNLDGIDLDYESINFGSTTAKETVRKYYPALLRNLDARLDRMGAVTSVTVAARTSRTDPNWWVYNYPALGRHADRVRIMTYDFHWSGGSPGPIAPKWWVNDVASYASRAIAPRKVSLGMPAYGRDWFVEKLSGTCPSSARETVSRTTRQMWEFAGAVGKSAQWRERATSRHFTYVRKYSSGGQTCQVKRAVWFDDGRSLDTKVQLVDKYGLRGIAIWALGNEGPGSWPLLREYGRTLAKS